MKLIPPREADVVHVRARGASKPRIPDFDSFVVETGHGILAFFHYIRELWQRRMLVRVLASRELKSTYEMNVVGFAWWLLEPLSMTAVYFVLINILTKRGSSDPTALVMILISLLSYKWLSQSLIGSMGVVRANSSLVTDVYFPRALLPVTQIVVGLAHFGVGLLTVPIFLFFAHVGYSWSVLWLPLIMAVQFFFMLGLAYPLSVWGLTYRNLPGLMSNVLRLWFYLSPGLYTLATVPAAGRTLMQFNPLTGLFESYRGALLTHQPPSWSLIWTAFFGALMVVFGGWYFTRREPHFGKML
jgi:homopolymeric O-antigen transport system permease protein